MLNQRLFGLIAVFTLLLPASVQVLFSMEQSADQTNSQMNAEKEEFSYASNVVKNLLKTLPKEKQEAETKAVTTAVSSQSGQPEEATPSSEEEQLKTIQDWKKELPLLKEDSPQADFINTIAPAAVLIANEHGIYPSVMIAQAALESSWGRSDLAQTYNNLMGTKGAWEGESVTVRTREDIDGESIYIDAGFSVYDSWADSLHRYGLLMKNGTKSNATIYEGTWRQNAATYAEATDWLQGRYATDTSYAHKLNQTIESFNLDQYDAIDPLEKDLETVLAQLTIEHETNL